MTREKPKDHVADLAYTQHFEKTEQKASKPKSCPRMLGEALGHHSASCVLSTREARTAEFVAAQERELKLLQGCRRERRRPFPLTVSKQPHRANTAVQDTPTPSRASSLPRQVKRIGASRTRLHEPVSDTDQSPSTPPRLPHPRGSDLAPTVNDRTTCGVKKSDDAHKVLHRLSKALDRYRHPISHPHRATSMYALNTSHNSTSRPDGVMATDISLPSFDDFRGNSIEIELDSSSLPCEMPHVPKGRVPANSVDKEGNDGVYRATSIVDMTPSFHPSSGDSSNSSSAHMSSDVVRGSLRAAPSRRLQYLDCKPEAELVELRAAIAKDVEGKKDHNQLGEPSTLSDGLLPTSIPSNFRQRLVFLNPQGRSTPTDICSSTAGYLSDFRQMAAKMEMLEAKLKTQQKMINLQEVIVKTQKGASEAQLATIMTLLKEQEATIEILEEMIKVQGAMIETLQDEIDKDTDLDAESAVMQTIKKMDASKTSTDRLIKNLKSHLDGGIKWRDPAMAEAKLEMLKKLDEITMRRGGFSNTHKTADAEKEKLEKKVEDLGKKRDDLFDSHKTTSADEGTAKESTGKGTAAHRSPKKRTASEWGMGPHGNGGFRLMCREAPSSSNRPGYGFVQEHQGGADSSDRPVTEVSLHTASSSTVPGNERHRPALDMTGQHAVSVRTFSKGEPPIAPDTKDVLRPASWRQKQLESEALVRNPSDHYMMLLKEIEREETLDTFKQNEGVSDGAAAKARNDKLMVLGKLWFGNVSYPYSDEARNNDTNRQAFIRKLLGLRRLQREKIMCVLRERAARSDEHSDGQSKEKAVGVGERGLFDRNDDDADADADAIINTVQRGKRKIRSWQAKTE
ncbi:uncharacterized protein BKCO1_2300035 [Diplodia corticola]|uniref:Uncharacterized protein n=1 Tax=Diplodia corticola TaxID=236234 RepID=A0A1J9QZ52_9PEZI|nr:uncharacterized protein BKCO1_2300035 [Diplodia corticola]OJD34358.1 hypothetical protein BKCO1_2300035 [Diplodia corticola]